MATTADSSLVFRTADEKVTKPPQFSKPDQTPGTAVRDEETELVATYKEVVGKPFVAVHYDVANIWDDPDGGFAEEINTIENYIKKMVTEKRLENSTDKAKVFLKEAEKAAGVDPKESTLVKIIKVAAFVKMKKEIDEAVKEITK